MLAFTFILENCSFDFNKMTFTWGNYMHVLFRAVFFWHRDTRVACIPMLVPSRMSYWDTAAMSVQLLHVNRQKWDCPEWDMHVIAPGKRGLTGCFGSCL